MLSFETSLALLLRTNGLKTVRPEEMRQHRLEGRADITYHLAYSGGLDSHVLLHLCAQLPIKLHAIHVNHGLSPHANDWEEHCAAVCQALNIPFTSHRIHIERGDGESPEAAARDQRYRILATALAPGDVLLTAHHQDDQAETLLVQLLRGAGPKGLAAMPAAKPFAQGVHERPLLDFTRADLLQYAKQHHLQWIEDESNLDVAFTRNFIRQQVMPLLQERWPSAATMLARSASHCAEAQALLEQMAAEDLKRVQGEQQYVLSVQRLTALEPARQRLLLRHWLTTLGYPVPEAVKMAAIQSDVLAAEWDRMPHIAWEGVELRRYRDDLYVMPCLAKHDVNQVFHWDMDAPLTLPGIGRLHASEFAKPQSVQVRFRQGGEVCWYREHHRELKKLFQDWGVPPWQRERIPLIFKDKLLLGVANYFIDQRYFEHKKGEPVFNLAPLES